MRHRQLIALLGGIACAGTDSGPCLVPVEAPLDLGALPTAQPNVFRAAFDNACDRPAEVDQDEVTGEGVSGGGGGDTVEPGGQHVVRGVVFADWTGPVQATITVVEPGGTVELDVLAQAFNLRLTAEPADISVSVPFGSRQMVSVVFSTQGDEPLRVDDVQLAEGRPGLSLRTQDGDAGPPPWTIPPGGQRSVELSIAPMRADVLYDVIVASTPEGDRRVPITVFARGQ